MTLLCKIIVAEIFLSQYLAEQIELKRLAFEINLILPRTTLRQKAVFLQGRRRQFIKNFIYPRNHAVVV